MLRSLTIVVAALGTILALPLAAQAYPAQTTASLNVRAGPGVGYHRVGVLPHGAVVNVRYCTSGWCQVDFRGTLAWASGRYLHGAAYVAPRYQPAPFFFYQSRPGFSIYIGPRQEPRQRPRRRPRRRPWWMY